MKTFILHTDHGEITIKANSLQAARKKAENAGLIVYAIISTGK